MSPFLRYGTTAALAALCAARLVATDAPPAPAEIAADLNRVRAFLDQAMPARMTDGRVDLGEHRSFNPLAYEAGVIHTGMLYAAKVTGDRRFSDFTAKQLRFISDNRDRFQPIVHPGKLDDCGSMCAALIEARLDGVGPDLKPVILAWTDYIALRQFRLPDGTLARQRPQPVSLWADDMYMSIPALAEMGRMTGDKAWWDDAVRNARQFSARLFRPRAGLFAHGWYEDNPDAPNFFWGRANGWAMLAIEKLLDVLPPEYPGRADLLKVLQAHLRGVAAVQSGDGRWHQLLDRNDTYLETSCSAMFVYGIAHAIDQGWINPVTYGSIAVTGWNAVATQIDPQGRVQNTCVGTTLAPDVNYYYHRPTSPYAMHGDGPVLLAGSEMLVLLRNPHFQVVDKNGTYPFIPR
jgi:rhamnogalacturonyl hydrolase YesR